jgi:two-component system, cell cycle sensor histidine kinase DivJ
MFGKLEQDRNREYAELIHDSGRHLLDLINDILDMSKIESGHFRIVAEPFDLAALIENCWQLLEPQADAAGLRIETDLPVSLPELVADRRACKQMLLNLLHNAMKFSNHGGRIVVGAYVDGGTTSVYVADEGDRHLAGGHQAPRSALRPAPVELRPQL